MMTDKILNDFGVFYRVRVNIKGIKEIASSRPPHLVFGHYTAQKHVDIDIEGLKAVYDKEKDVLIITNPRVVCWEMRVDE